MLTERIARGLGEVRDATTATFESPSQWLLDAFGGGSTIAGARINDRSSLAIPAYYAATRIIAETMGSMPCQVRQYTSETSDVHTPARGDELWTLLHDRPNPELHAGDFWEVITTHLSLRGNAYCFRQRDGMGNVIALWPIPPHLVRVERDQRTRRKVFLVSPDPEAAVPMIFENEDILHFRGFGPDPLRGLSPIGALREMLGRAIAEQDHQSASMKNQVRPSGVLYTDKKLDEVKGRRIARQFKRAVAGARNAGATVILEEGLKWQQVSMTAADAQFIEQREFTVRDVARVTRIPADMLLVQTGGDMHYTSDESVGLRFLTWTMTPWRRRIEGPLSIDDSLPWRIGDAPRKFPYFQSDLLLRVDRKTRFEAWAIAIRNGWMAPDEVRIAEGRAPLGGAYAMPRLDLRPPSRETGDVTGRSASEHELDDPVDRVLAELV